MYLNRFSFKTTLMSGRIEDLDRRWTGIILFRITEVVVIAQGLQEGV